MTRQPILLAGEWQQASTQDFFSALNPSNGLALAEKFPKSSWSDCEVALSAASDASSQLSIMTQSQAGRDQIGLFLEAYAELIQSNALAIAETAHLETGLAISPRLVDVELPRTINQLQQAAKSAREASWAKPTIDTQVNIRSWLEPIGPVIIFGPNNFPCAFGSVSGGDFAAAIAAGNPVIAKANPCHPATTKLFAELAFKALAKTELPKETVQLLYYVENDDGCRLVSDQRVGATAFTGSKAAGLVLKQAADAAGKPIYLEMSSLNPVVILEGALKERSESVAEELSLSCTMAAGQLCTKPGLILVPTGLAGDHFVNQVRAKFEAATIGTLFTAGAPQKIDAQIQSIVKAGARLETCSKHDKEQRFCVSNSLLTCHVDQFLEDSKTFEQEVFGNVTLIVRFDSLDKLVSVAKALPGQLTACIYSHTNGSDEQSYQKIVQHFTKIAGRVINDKMPTGVAVSAAMNHGGPYPAAGHPSFSAVGLPGSIQRFAALRCYDQVRESRLPDALQNTNPANIWRFVDGEWSRKDI